MKMIDLYSLGIELMTMIEKA